MKYKVSIHFYSCRMFEQVVTNALSSETAVMQVIAASIDYNFACFEKFGSKMNDTIRKIEVEEEKI